MGPARMVVLAIAAVAALLLMLIVRGIVGHKPAPAPTVAAAPAAPMTQVLVANRDLAVGTRLASGDLAWQPWPATAVNPAFITDGRAAPPPATTGQMVGAKVAAAAQSVVGGPMDATYGSIVREKILAHEPINRGKLVRAGQGGFMSVVLDPGMRAFAVPITAVTGVGGFVLPGDRVDVLQSRPNDAANGGKPGFTAVTLLRNVRILAIDQTSEAPKTAQFMLGAVATLEVAAIDVPMLVKAKAQGEMLLSLRSYSDATGPATIGDDNTGDVRIYRNGQVSDVTVTP